MIDLISKALQDIYPGIPESEADDQAVQIFYSSEDYLTCLDELLSGNEIF